MLHAHQKLGLFFLLLSLSLSLADPVYMAIGGDAVLRPPPMDLPIKSIEWKHNEDIAADWHGNEFECFGQFKGRCEVNPGTGALTIKGLKLTDSGIYTPEINFKVFNKIELSVVSRVAKPSVKTSCNPENTDCNLACEGNTADAEPVTYKWFLDGRDGPSEKVLAITKDTKENSFRCMMKNPVSNETSESITNPIIKQLDPLALVFGLGVPLLAVIAAIAAYFIYRCITGTKYELKPQNNSKGQHSTNQHHSNGIAQRYRHVSYTSVPKDDQSGALLTSVVVHNQQTSEPLDTNKEPRREEEREEGTEEEMRQVSQSPDDEGQPKDNQHLSNGAVATGTQGTDQVSVTQNGFSGAETESVTPETSSKSPAEAAVSDTDQKTELSSVEPTCGPLDTNKDSEKSALMSDKTLETNCEPSDDEQEGDDQGHVD
ncbi:V-set and immunoglobulin domain-containing protein 1-like isoform X2 [Cheilinus undulatus]|uniref:V-set and immunoglobulin domain-containing protein 1-like isoform X2 n=1 Tax=Cheilinus undulatus TaxID=241271 RepID=UPI001BD4B5FD|nr:V-set and immunoglobulin domain-containing protein 1-like isoform X2 [Cheilinus undulatus]